MKSSMKTGAFLASLLVIAACKANVNVQTPPSPSPSPTATATATPVPSPTPTPGWVSVTLRPTLETQDALQAEIQKLEAQGQVCCVTIMKSNPVQIQLSAAPETIARLEEIAAGVKVVSFNTLSQRSSNIRELKTVVISDAQAFNTLWQQHIGSADTPPTVDFFKQSVLAVFGGEKPTGGYTAVVDSVKQLNKTLTVNWQVTSPPPNTPVTQAVTYPAHIIVIPLSKQNGDFDQVNFVAKTN